MYPLSRVVRFHKVNFKSRAKIIASEAFNLLRPKFEFGSSLPIISKMAWCNSFEEREDQNKVINDRELVLGPQKGICQLLIDLESKCFKEQYILTHVIFYFVERLDCKGPHNIAAQNVIFRVSLRNLTKCNEITPTVV